MVEGKAPAPEVVIMEALSEAYGWTPSEIRAQRAEDVKAYLEIRRIKQRIYAEHTRASTGSKTSRRGF